jgi:hypothetical protein
MSTDNRDGVHVHQPVQYARHLSLLTTQLTPAETRWGFGLPMKDIDLPPEEIVRHYFTDLWADMCK